MLKGTNNAAHRATILAQGERLRDSGEFGAIGHFATLLGTRTGVRVGIGDDCAVLNPLSAPVISCDALVEGVHFRRDWTSAFDLGRKTLAVSVSDLASTGAYPIAAFLSLCAPPDLEMAWLNSFYKGMESLAEEFKFSLAGGDTTRAPQLVLSATLIGDLLPEAQGQPVLREGAQIGDLICISGNLGASAAGLQLLLSGKTAITPAHQEVLSHHFNPLPRLQLMRALLGANREAIHAALDISDGVSGDASHIAERSLVRLKIDANRLQIAPSTREVAQELGLDARVLALSGGEDYQLLMCIAPRAFEHLNESVNGALTCIGVVVEGETGVDVDNVRDARSWTHF
ncbi:thiamine-monophosphate kinase [Abditibacteriota bacterium]|nr:thiamine-monophosphate kinase [Abditibacteriota bacterium]